jgi:hypothetical protein
MKGIYLTEEGKQEIKAKIAEIEQKIVLLQEQYDECNTIKNNAYSTKQKLKMLYPDWKINKLAAFSLLNTYKEILSSATTLPVKESWDYILNTYKSSVLEHYKQGVIIQPKSL